MSTVTKRATIDDLYHTEGKAELIGGRIVQYIATGRRPNRVAARIFRSLDDHATACGVGEAYTDSMGFTVPEVPSGRESFSPDTSYYSGVFPSNEMKFIAGPPTFAVEVRSENAYKRSAEIDIDAKRADAPTNPVTFGRGQTADAEPAVPGWRVSVDEIFA